MSHRYRSRPSDEKEAFGTRTTDVFCNLSLKVSDGTSAGTITMAGSLHSTNLMEKILLNILHHSVYFNVAPFVTMKTCRILGPEIFDASLPFKVIKGQICRAILHR